MQSCSLLFLKTLILSAMDLVPAFAQAFTKHPCGMAQLFFPVAVYKNHLHQNN